MNQPYIFWFPKKAWHHHVCCKMNVFSSICSNQQAVEILKNTGSSVHLTIVRYLRGLKFEELQDGIKAANATTPTSPYTTSPSVEVKLHQEDITSPLPVRIWNWKNFVKSGKRGLFFMFSGSTVLNVLSWSQFDLGDSIFTFRSFVFSTKWSP